MKGTAESLSRVDSAVPTDSYRDHPKGGHPRFRSSAPSHWIVYSPLRCSLLYWKAYKEMQDTIKTVKSSYDGDNHTVISIKKENLKKKKTDEVKWALSQALSTLIQIKLIWKRNFCYPVWPSVHTETVSLNTENRTFWKRSPKWINLKMLLRQHPCAHAHACSNMHLCNPGADAACQCGQRTF